MGLFGSDSHTNVQNDYNIDSSTKAANNGGIAAGGDVTLTDPGSYAFAHQTVNEVFGFANETLKNVQQQQQASNAETLAAVQAIEKSKVGGVDANVILIGLATLVTGFVLYKAAH